MHEQSRRPPLLARLQYLTLVWTRLRIELRTTDSVRFEWFGPAHVRVWFNGSVLLDGPVEQMVAHRLATLGEAVEGARSAPIGITPDDDLER